MISIGQEHRVSIADNVRDTLAVGGVEKLLPEALRRINSEVIHLFEDWFTVLAVVLVRWKAAPVSCRVERFSDHDSLSDRVVDEDVVDLARIVAPAACIDADVGG